MKSIKEALREGRELLKKITDIPKKEAMILASFVLKKDETYLFLYENDKFKEYDKFIALVQRRAEGEPIEYITKSVSFYGEKFFIDKGALIPRPETELLIDEVVKNIEKLELKNPKIAEIGTGSGIISIILSLKFPDARIIATDISKDALKIARKNIDKFGAKDRIDLVNTSYLDGIDNDVDIIVSNPPYVANDFEVAKPLHYEPKEAIFGGVGGDEVLLNIIELAKKRKVTLLACEMGYDQKERLSSVLKKQNYEKIYFYKDLAGLDRGFIACLNRER
jgi:release factor glutamine methyltransferase